MPYVDPIKRKENSRRYYLKNKERILLQVKQRAAQCRSEKAIYDLSYYVKNRQEIIDRKVRQRAEKLKSDSLFKMVHRLRKRTSEVIGGRTFRFLGCSPTELRSWLSSKFVDGMTLDNHGIVWDIDHVIPCSAWDFRDPEHVRACFHWTNLQPLFKYENQAIKSGANRYPAGHFDATIAERLMMLRALEVL